MGSKRGIINCSVALFGIAAIIGSVWLIKERINANSQTPYYANKMVTAISSKVSIQTKEQLALIDPQLKKEEKLINDFARANISYQFGDQEEVVDSELIKKWITLDQDEVVLHEDEVQLYVKQLADKYDTVGKEREFVDSHGEVVTVSGGPYGWEINQKDETKELITLIKEKAVVKNREPVYKHTAFTRGSSDIGNTYVEVNMSEQKMWYYKDGELLVATNIVTGNMARGHATPTVVGYIYNKVRDTNLVGTGYVAFVHYWMKVYGSIGIHDASWRTKFGGSIYTTNGSHGCINTPSDQVKLIFDQIEIGTPVILFYEKEKKE